MSNIYDFALYALLNIEPMKRFECRSAMRVLRSTGDGASWCILNLLEPFAFGDGK